MGYYEARDYATACVSCASPLSGRQERYCSASCRQAAYRASKRPGRPERRTCELCGGVFEPIRARQKYCTYDEAGHDCVNLQEDLLELAEEAHEARLSAQCVHCGESAGWTGKGRPRKYCSRRCKVADFRRRKADEKTLPL